METNDFPPWECIDPALTPERLAAIAAIIRDETDAKIRARVARDWNWNIGCDCHAWVLDRLHEAAKGEYADWLHMESAVGCLDVDFRIGDKKSGIPAKIYRPDAPGQPGRTLGTTNEKLTVIQPPLGDDFAVAADPAIRFAYDKDADGHIINVQLVQLGVDGSVLYPWTIWSADKAVIPIEAVPQPEEVQLGEPNVTLPEDEELAKRKNEQDLREGA